MVVLGPPGSGKGTRARIIGKMFGIPVITTGDMLREAAAEGTEMGLLADGYMKRGELVRDDIVIAIVEERLKKSDVEGGFVLDGFPRSMSQAEALDRILKQRGAVLDAVLNVVASPDTIVSRLSLRRSCPKCGAVYHLKDMPPEDDEICDECGSQLIQRDDDKVEIIRHRLEVYQKQTFPILERYKKEGRVKEISGELAIDQIPDEVRRVLEAP
ncbi:MAG: adenylate kinase [Candidatus Bathyarchaeota archaeon]|nr:adenylate kinase [Candidatus Bathyarchaeota archaeon]